MAPPKKVKRYWPGKAPEWGDDGDADEDGDIRVAAPALEKACPADDDSDVVRKDDRRLRRLAESRVDNIDEIRADHRRIRQAEIVSTVEEEENRRNEGMEAEEEDEDALKEERRIRNREKSLQRQQEETAALSEEEEAEYETDSEEEENVGIPMVKTVYVPKSERDTIAEREGLEAEERALEEAEKRKLERRKVETRQIVVDKIKEDEENEKNKELEANVVVDDDEVNKAEEYEAWKVREFARIKREAMIKHKQEIDKVPKPAPPPPRPRQKRKFMQKHYHKGAFFQSEADDPASTVGTDNIYDRDFSSPTGEDKMDKTMLPKVMQVKHFGRSGRTKWTHLLNEDTTDWNNPWTYNHHLRSKYYAKMAALNTPIAKPKGSKKLKFSF
ncbi:hypothetical protein COLO4_23028 [Corchorus olitorius]|uniref:Micro-fibrillar-associated protein 1 C-terminal domain-containing protein n=1 Tax=Corchorus olitorius TaxID=93759 RepID=A0A1R3IIR1_9ROSI|nr:hypothetical protein COLO4_23028 [Corchorus olitorius]